MVTGTKAGNGVIICACTVTTGKVLEVGGAPVHDGA